MPVFIVFWLEVGGGETNFAGGSASLVFYCATYGIAISDVLDDFITGLAIVCSLFDYESSALMSSASSKFVDMTFSSIKKSKA